MNLKAKPFYLNDEQIAWVESTLASMTLEEKVGQLFCPISYSSDPGYLTYQLLRFHVGGLLFKTSPSAEVRSALDFMQKGSRIPVLSAANLEFGSTGFLEDGTFFAQQLGIGATRDPEQAYRMGRVATKEAAAAGCNWAFAPICDLDLNWRNPIVNVRSYGIARSRSLPCARPTCALQRKTMWLCPSSTSPATAWMRWISTC